MVICFIATTLQVFEDGLERRDGLVGACRECREIDGILTEEGVFLGATEGAHALPQSREVSLNHVEIHDVEHTVVLAGLEAFRGSSGRDFALALPGEAVGEVHLQQ